MMKRKAKATKATGEEVVKAIKALKPTGNSEFDVTLGDLRDHLDALQTLQARLKDHRDAIQRFHATRSELVKARIDARAPAARARARARGRRVLLSAARRARRARDRRRAFDARAPPHHPPPLFPARP